MPRIQELTIISAQIPTVLRDQLQELADEDERTLSHVVRCALKQYVRDQGEKAA